MSAVPNSLLRLHSQTSFDRGSNAAGEDGLCSGTLQPLSRFHPRFGGLGSHARFDEVSGELLFPVRTRFHRRSWPSGRSVLKASPSWPQPKLRTSSSGTDRRAARDIRTSRKARWWCRRNSTRRGGDLHPSAQHLLDAYREIHQKATATLMEKLPRPAEMKPEAYARNIAARAFDVARYLLPFGIPTGVGQVTSIRTLERQVKPIEGFCISPNCAKLQTSWLLPAPPRPIAL